MDFSTSFRHLVHFSPSHAVASSQYLSDYLVSFVQAGIVARKQEEVEQAIEGWKSWFEAYARRISEAGEKEAWGGDDWEVRRKEEMIRVNPRFVVRQWVLEALIKGMEGDLSKGERDDARKKLANILKVSLHIGSVDCGWIC